MDYKVELMLKDKLNLFKYKGFSYNPETGDVISNTGRFNKKRNRHI